MRISRALWGSFSFAAVSLVGAQPAHACQGIQFESDIHFLSSEPATEIPQGMKQYRILIHQNDLRSISDRALLFASIRDFETGERLASDADLKSIAMVIPTGTSCDNTILPEPGEYYVVGGMPLSNTGASVIIKGSALFYPMTTRTRTTAALFQPER